MQTFLAYSSYERSAQVLDDRRLGKQRVECLQILNALKKGPISCPICKDGMSALTPKDSDDNPFICSKCKVFVVKTPWYNHPAIQMWKGFEQSLIDYGLSICKEWKNRGFKDTCETKIFAFWLDFKHDYTPPPWVGNEKFHAAHRSNLLRKDFTWYGRFGWLEPNDLPYIWPTKENL